jgi:hypothetical protein
MVAWGCASSSLSWESLQERSSPTRQAVEYRNAISARSRLPDRVYWSGDASSALTAASLMPSTFVFAALLAGTDAASDARWHRDTSWDDAYLRKVRMCASLTLQVCGCYR